MVLLPVVVVAVVVLVAVILVVVRFWKVAAVCLCFYAIQSLAAAVFMAALCNRAGHIYFHAVVTSFCLYFPRLISAVGDWMSTILPHMVWP